MSAARVAFLDHAPFIGGAETVLLDLIAHLDRSRFDPLVFVPAQSPLVQRLEAIGVPWCHLPMPRINAPSPRVPIRWLSASRRLSRLARERGINLIHANTVRAHLISAFASAAPVVWMLHDDTFPVWLFHALRRRPARLIANSRATAHHYRIESDPRSAIVHNGVDTRAAPGDGAAFRRQFGIDPEAILVAHVGRLVRWKGQDVFIRAAGRIAPSFPQARFALIGGHAESDNARSELGGGAAYFDELRQLAETSGLENRLIFAGHQDGMANAYAAIDVLVHSSTRPEPFGRVLIEAMSAGVPVIAAAHGGPIEIVEDGVTGLLVPPGDPERLADAVTELIADETRRQVMGRAARQRAVERFDIRVQVERIQSIYADILTHQR